MSNGFDTVEKKFSEIKRLVSADPFERFAVCAGGEIIPVDHQNCIAFHPEVPYLTVHTRTDIYKVAVEDVELIREAYSS